ncbi:MAG TPA: CDP-alcohol phosphatidyltransferase family protein [Candidatus Binataceae bacterium]|nr:CDP-alcohol phosphatidyltransferase family protein [Candidatus Binataceae bacterium]
MRDRAEAARYESIRSKPGLTAQIPNAISFARLVAAPILFWLAYSRNELIFKWLLLASLLSDIADGLIARQFNLVTVLGAKLDSIADQLTTAAAVTGLIVLRRNFMNEHWLALISIVGCYLLSDAAALMRYGRLASLHTYLARGAAYAQGIFIMTLFIWGYQQWMLPVLVTLSIAAYCEEIAIIAWMLPTWRANVRGIYWLLQEERSS